jgi:uncharacterized protein YeaO (DUF488 family)
MEPRLVTWFWKAALAQDVTDRLVLVRISVGRPRWVRSAVTQAIPYVEELAPVGLRHIEDDAEFERLYRDRLDGFGIEALDARFQELHDGTQGRPLALLCFEHDPKECHRVMFAKWWQERTGEIVREWET